MAEGETRQIWQARPRAEAQLTFINAHLFFLDESRESRFVHDRLFLLRFVFPFRDTVSLPCLPILLAPDASKIFATLYVKKQFNDSSLNHWAIFDNLR